MNVESRHLKYSHWQSKVKQRSPRNKKSIAVCYTLWELNERENKLGLQDDCGAKWKVDVGREGKGGAESQRYSRSAHQCGGIIKERNYCALSVRQDVWGPQQGGGGARVAVRSSGGRAESRGGQGRGLDLQPGWGFSTLSSVPHTSPFSSITFFRPAYTMRRRMAMRALIVRIR